MNAHDIALIRHACPKLSAIAEPAAALFSRRLFETDAGARGMTAWARR